jgi:hypothetical protein
MNKRKVVFYSLILAVSLLFPAFSGCKATTSTTSQSVTTDNTTITYTPVENTGGEKYFSFSATGIPLFSFEYPVDYVVKSDQTMPDSPSTALRILPSTVLNETTNTSVITTVTPYSTVYIVTALPPDALIDLNGYDFIFIYVTSLSGNNHTADIKIDKTTNELKHLEADYIKDLKIIYIRQVVVGRIQGWEVKYSFTNYPRNAFTVDHTKPTSMIERDIYFDYEGMSFRIDLYSDAAIIDKTGKAYEHILQTFKLLE